MIQSITQLHVGYALYKSYDCTHILTVLAQLSHSHNKFAAYLLSYESQLEAFVCLLHIPPFVLFARWRVIQIVRTHYYVIHSHAHHLNYTMYKEIHRHFQTTSTLLQLLIDLQSLVRQLGRR